MNDKSKEFPKLSSDPSKWYDGLASDQLGPNSERLIEWVKLAAPPVPFGVLEVEFQNSAGVTKKLKAAPCEATPKEFKGVLFDGDIFAAEMSIAWSKDPSKPALFTVTPTNTVAANEHYSVNDYPLANGTDVNSFFTALCKAIEEQISVKQL